MQDPFDFDFDITELLEYPRKSSLKTDLFVKATQLKKMSQYLENVMLLPKKKREEWVAENEELLNKVMNEFAEDSNLVLDALEGDPQAMALSMEYVSNLRDVMNVVRSIFYDSTRLKS